MDTNEAQKQDILSTPYVAFKTFRAFVDGLKTAMPGRIDRSIMHTMSGGTQRHLMHSLRAMDLVSPQGIPTELFKKLVKAEGDERKEAMIDALKVGYPFLFDDSINLETATGKQLLDQFKQGSLTGDSVRKAVSFFLAAAKDAGMKVSPYFEKIQARSGSPKKPNGSPPSESTPKSTKTQEQQVDPERSRRDEKSSIPAESSLLLWGLFQRLPKPGSVWPRDERDRWTETLNNVLGLEYKEK